jgi:hypothetical protein
MIHATRQAAMLASLLASCGSSPHASDDAVVPRDADVRACPVGAAFAAPVAVPGLAVADELLGVAFSRDELTAYFSEGGGYAAIFTAQRPSVGGTFAGATVLTALGGNTAAESTKFPTLTNDDRAVYFERDDTSQAPTKLGIATATRSGSGFASPTAVAGLAGFGQPYLVGDPELYLVGDGGANHADIYVASRSGTSFATPTLVSAVSSSAYESHPVVSDDDLELWFLRSSSTGSKVMTSQRERPDQPFGAPAELDGVSGSSSAPLAPAWLSADGCRLYLASTTTTGGTVMVAQRTAR